MIRAANAAMLDHIEECSAMLGLLTARRRYFEMRAALPCDDPLDIDLHAELTAVIQAIDGKIARRFPAGARD